MAWIETEGWAERNAGTQKSLRIGVHHADAVVRGPVCRTRLIPVEQRHRGGVRVRVVVVVAGARALFREVHEPVRVAVDADAPSALRSRARDETRRSGTRRSA